MIKMIIIARPVTTRSDIKLVFNNCYALLPPLTTTWDSSAQVIWMFLDGRYLVTEVYAASSSFWLACRPRWTYGVLLGPSRYQMGVSSSFVKRCILNVMSMSIPSS